VTKDGVWVGNWIYWTLTDRNYSTIANSHTPQFTTACTKSSQSAVSSPVDVPLFPGSHPRRLAAISHQPPTLLIAISWLSHYIALAWTTQKTPFPTVTTLLRVTQLLPSNDCFSGSTVLVLRKYATILSYLCLSPTSLLFTFPTKIL
jgi:hypothetical protein